MITSTRRRNVPGSALGCTAAVCCLLSAPAVLGGEVLYATGLGHQASGGLWAVNASNGDSVLLHSYPGHVLTQGGLAYDRASDTLYASGTLESDPTSPYLFVLDRFTGAIRTVGRIQGPGSPGSWGIAVHPGSGKLYGVGTADSSQSTGLFLIDKQTAVAGLVGVNGPSCCRDPFGFVMGGVGFRSNGDLYANGYILSGGVGSALFSVDLAGGAALQVGAHEVAVGRGLQFSGLAFRADGKLFSLGSKDAATPGLYLVDPATGKATLVGGTDPRLGTDGGLDFAPGPRPFLKFKPLGLPRLRLAWTGDVAFAGAALQVNKSLSGDGWQNVTEVPANVDGEFHVDVDLGESQALYRLVEP